MLSKIYFKKIFIYYQWMFDIYLYIYIPGVSEYMIFTHFIYVHTGSLWVYDIYTLYTYIPEVT